MLCHCVSDISVEPERLIRFMYIAFGMENMQKIFEKFYFIFRLSWQIVINFKGMITTDWFLKKYVFIILAINPILYCI